MTAQDTSSYDEVPYASHAFPQTHPDHLSVVGRLFGMSPAPLDRCRVLELGCAGGGNLIPMAAQMPESTFLGVDLSARQVGDGKALISDLSLSNIELRHASILDVDALFGQFDYIIAHGVYSWVPADVQDKILAISKQNLAPQGIAYISYNTNPGWRMRGMIRDAMLYHSQRFDETQQQIQQARAVLDFLAQNVPTENNPYGLLLKQELAVLSGLSDSYLLHDFLEDINEPLYFREFAGRAAAKGLQYLGEADFRSMLASDFSQSAAQTLRMIAPDITRMEQYMDFLRNRSFRQTLLVHCEVPLKRNLGWRSLVDLHVASPARPVNTNLDIRSDAVEKFRTPSGATLSTPQPISKAAVAVLGERWPATIPFEDLCVAARCRLEAGAVARPDPITAERDRKLLGAEMLRYFAAAIVELRSVPNRFTLKISIRPRANPLSRLEATKGPHITSLRHETVTLDDFDRQVLRHLDGQHDRSAVVDILTGLVSDGALKIEREGQLVTGESEVRGVLMQVLEDMLPKLARAALLEA